MNQGLQQALFEEREGIDGWCHEDDWLSAAEEGALLEVVRALPLQPMRYKDFVARRRGISFGGHYDFDANRLLPSPALPPALEPLRARVAEWADLPSERWVHVLVAEYAPGTPLGWHRDVPDFEQVVGVSLAGEATMALRRYPPRPRGDPLGGRLRQRLAPRSIYRLQGPARWDWQHSIEPTDALRYSITFRSARGR